MSRRQVVHVTNDFRINGTGITEFIRALAVRQAADGSEVTVLCAQSDLAMTELMQWHSVRIVVVGDRNRVRELQPFRRVLSQADVIHVHTVRAFLRALFCVPLRTWGRTVSTVHNPYSSSSRLLGLTAETVHLAPMVRPRFPSRGRSSFIPNPVVHPVEALARTGTLVRALPPLAVLYLGGLSHRKGTDVLLDAWAHVSRAIPGASLHLVGNRDAPHYEQRVSSSPEAHSIVFHGLRPDPRPYLESATVFVLPSRREGFPLVLPQARAAGVAIVATAVDGAVDALDQGAAGLLVPPGDVRALGHALIGLLSDPSARADWARAARANLDRLHVDRIREQYERVYDALTVRR